MRKSAISLLFLLCATLLQASTMSRCLERMPSSIREELSKSMVKDLIDFYQAGQRAVVKNRFGGNTVLLSLSDTTLQMQVSSQLLVEMRLLPIAKDSALIAVVENYGDTIVDGQIHFYTTDWQPVERDKYFRTPSLEQFLPSMTPELSVLWSDMASELSFSFVAYRWADTTNELILTWDIEPFLTPENRKKAMPLLANKTQRYLWKDGVLVWQSRG